MPTSTRDLRWTMKSKDKRAKRDKHALNADGMVLCNPRNREAAHRAETEGIATENLAQVTCRKCLALLHKRDRSEVSVLGTHDRHHLHSEKSTFHKPERMLSRFVSR